MSQTIEELEKAIVDANNWVLAGEGVSLTYYSWPDYGQHSLQSAQPSKDVIEQVLRKHCRHLLRNDAGTVCRECGSAL